MPLTRHFVRSLMLALTLGCGGGTAPVTVDDPALDDAGEGARLAGRWRKAPEAEKGLLDEISALEAIGYLAGYEPSTGASGVTVHVADRAWQGVNLYTSGHGQTALLVGMDGTVLHQWTADFRTAFPKASDDLTPEEGRFRDRRERWRRAHLFPNGDLIAIYEGFGLVKVDKDSNVLWAKRNNAHHDLWVGDDGTIVVLTRAARINRRFNAQQPILEDYVSWLTPEGEEVRRVSILEALLDSDFATLIEHTNSRGDVLHTNTVSVLDGTGAERVSALRAGNVLLSMPKLDTVAILDPDAGRIVWALAGMWDFQHEPVLLPTGTLMVFDNQGHQGMSKVVELDPASQQVVWAYRGTPENGFFTDSCGSNQRLPNGNTLITESDAGRAFEVTRDGEIVWEFYNPARAGEEDELIATLFEVVRLEPGELEFLP